MGAGEELNERIYACKRQALGRALAALGVARERQVLGPRCRAAARGFSPASIIQAFPRRRVCRYRHFRASHRASAASASAVNSTRRSCEWDASARLEVRHHSEPRSPPPDSRRRHGRRAIENLARQLDARRSAARHCGDARQDRGAGRLPPLSKPPFWGYALKSLEPPCLSPRSRSTTGYRPADRPTLLAVRDDAPRACARVRLDRAAMASRVPQPRTGGPRFPHAASDDSAA